MVIHPKALEPGDLIGLVAPASPPQNPSLIDEIIAGIEKSGFKVLPSPNLRKRKGFLAGTDKERASDLMRMFLDRRTKGVFCLRGGYGSARILGLLDYRAIGRSRKVFFGFSDITSLHSAITRNSGLITFHGSVGSTFLEGGGKFIIESFKRTVMEPCPPGSILQGLSKKEEKLTVLRKGTAAGRIIGGNLSLLCTLPGTPFLPAFDRKILLIEDTGEQSYRIDRLLTHLLNAGLLQKLAGIAAGRFTIEGSSREKRQYERDLIEILKDRLSGLGVPVLAGLPVGHTAANAVIPVGAKVTLRASSRPDLVVEEACVE